MCRSPASQVLDPTSALGPDNSPQLSLTRSFFLSLLPSIRSQSEVSSDIPLPLSGFTLTLSTYTALANPQHDHYDRSPEGDEGAEVGCSWA